MIYPEIKDIQKNGTPSRREEYEEFIEELKTERKEKRPRVVLYIPTWLVVAIIICIFLFVAILLTSQL